jgi:hypothetical protein
MGVFREGAIFFKAQSIAASHRNSLARHSCFRNDPRKKQ